MITDIIHKFCNRFDISILYHSKVGLKCTNQFLSSENFNYFNSGEITLLSPEILCMPLDGLKDLFTLIGSSIIDSPHFKLMQIFQQGGDVTYSEYLERVANGTLDFRPAKKVGIDYIKFLRNKFDLKMNSIQKNVYNPVKIFNIKNKYYIADGKHTTAICALIGVNVKCIDITPILSDSFFWWIYRKMVKLKKDYSKHIIFFESIMKEKNEI